MNGRLWVTIDDILSLRWFEVTERASLVDVAVMHWRSVPPDCQLYDTAAGDPLTDLAKSQRPHTRTRDNPSPRKSFSRKSVARSPKPRSLAAILLAAFGVQCLIR